MLIPSWIGSAAVAAANKVVDKPVAKKGIILVDAEQLQLCAPSMNEARATVMSGLINQLFPSYGIITKDVLHEPLANFLQESLEFQYKKENMYYRAATIRKTWPTRFLSIKDAEPFAKNPKALANKVYGAVGNRLGNIPGTDDGWNLRGSGFVGLTGRYVLTEYAKYKGLKTAEEAADYARDSDYGALDSALWFFCVLKDLMDESEKDDFIGIVKEINGGTIGLKDRLYYYDLVKKHIV